MALASPRLSLIIPSLNRPKELNACLQQFADWSDTCELIVLTERGPLAHLRNLGWRRARAPVVSFLDDDVLAASAWVPAVLAALSQPGVVGVTGPSVVLRAWQRHRDLFRFRWLHQCFLDTDSRRYPGHLSAAGAISLEASKLSCAYTGPVQYLEACNMSFTTAALQAVGGFDETYAGIGDWSEPDLCFRLRARFGPTCLRFDPEVRVTHYPSRSGAFLLRRADAAQRLANYEQFAARWVRPSVSAWTYRHLLRAYYLGMTRWPR